ncbi:MAG: nucleotidyltransferase domain-containing protein [Candidatus Paceibacterota bacterium]|jgi:predicted nucleotidyltransferase
MTLNDLIQNLKSKEEIDAVFVTGSQGLGEQKSYSDIDLVIVFKENTQKLFSLFQFIDGKPADIFFYDIPLLEKLKADKEISANTMDAVLINWLEKANIEFDKSGTITSMKDDVENLKKKLQVPVIEMKKFESLINSGYITNKRYFESNDPEYLEALEIKLLYDLNNILMGYFEFRNIPWRGEKQVLKYLRENDSEFYNLYMFCIKAVDIKEKFDAYLKLVKTVFSGSYGLWNEDIINPFIKGQLEEEGRNHLIEYWNNLIK